MGEESVVATGELDEVAATRLGPQGDGPVRLVRPRRDPGGR
ncbi:hypothetical protein [Actinomadura sp. DC4]|nr:hypothetical protein [Actinomadura sp. DC4]MDN3353179.1 hypothetical protein [Actinomadura sp. DC4]